MTEIDRVCDSIMDTTEGTLEGHGSFVVDRTGGIHAGLAGEDHNEDRKCMILDFRAAGSARCCGILEVGRIDFVVDRHGEMYAVRWLAQVHNYD
jgi:hypothetical protein